MEKYLLDTNAYFELLKYAASEKAARPETVNKVLNGKCYISVVTKIEIISVIGKYARGSNGSPQRCERIHMDTGKVCGQQYVVPHRKKWKTKQLRNWLKIEKDVSDGKNKLFNVTVLDINEQTLVEAQVFIRNALTHSFKSMDAVILGTAKAFSTDNKQQIIVVTGDKAFKAAMECIEYPCMSLGM